MPTSTSSSRRGLAFALGCGLFCGLVLATSPAYAADDDREFQEHYQRGVQLYKLNFLRQAVKEFVAAYAVNPLPRLLYNMGQLQRKLGDYKDSAESYELYLRTETEITPERRAEVQRYLDALRSASSGNLSALPPVGESAAVGDSVGTSTSSAPPTLLMILPPSATGKAGKYMFNMGFGIEENPTIAPVCEAGENRDRCRESSLDGRLHLALGTRWAHGPFARERAWDK